MCEEWNTPHYLKDTTSIVTNQASMYKYSLPSSLGQLFSWMEAFYANKYYKEENQKEKKWQKGRENKMAKELEAFVYTNNIRKKTKGRRKLQKARWSKSMTWLHEKKRPNIKLHIFHALNQ